MSVRIAAGGDAGEAITRVVPRLVDERVASGITAQDPDLWGPDAVAGARLGWTEAVADARPLVAEVGALRERLAASGVDRVVLLGAGGAAVAAQVIAATQRVPLEVVDFLDGAAVEAVLADRAGSTVAVVLAEPGTEPETARYRRAAVDALGDAARVVVVADAGDPLLSEVRTAGHPTFTASAGAGGAYSALTAFGLVPAGLAGADLTELLDEAESELLDLAVDAPTNNGLVLGAAIAAANPRRDLLVVVADGTHVVGLGDWIAGLLAAVTGKAGTGVLPVVVEHGAPELTTPPTRAQVLRLVADATDDRHDPLLEAGELLLSGSLGELLLVWEYAAAVAARLIGVDPFAHADVEAVEARLREPLDVPAAPEGLALEGHGDDLFREDDTAEAIDRLLAAAPEDGTVAVVVHGDLGVAARLLAARAALAARSGRPVVVDRAPRSLHSTAALRLGGPAAAALVVIATPGGPDDGWSGLVRTQGTAEAEALVARGGPVLVVRATGADAAGALLTAVQA